MPGGERHRWALLKAARNHNAPKDSSRYACKQVRSQQSYGQAHEEVCLDADVLSALSENTLTLTETQVEIAVNK